MVEAEFAAVAVAQIRKTDQMLGGYRSILPPSRSKLYPNSALSGQITC